MNTFFEVKNVTFSSSKDHRLVDVNFYIEEQGQILSPCRKKALIELSKGTNSQDKAWALRNIAILMQNGISFDGIQIKNETGVKSK